MPKETIAQYLNEQAQKILEDNLPTVENGHNISVHYIGRLNDTDVFDTSLEHIAKVSGKYHPQRDYTSGLSFKVGAGQMIAGFDKGVVGMKIGETKTLLIPAHEAYGDRREDMIVEVPLAHLPEKEGGFVIGDELYTQMGQKLTIVEVNDETVKLDQNHELAGKDLIFDITVIEIK